MQSVSHFSGVGFGLKILHDRNKIQIPGWKADDFLNTNIIKYELALNTRKHGLALNTRKHGLALNAIAGRGGIPDDEIKIAKMLRATMKQFKNLTPPEKRFLKDSWERTIRFQITGQEPASRVRMFPDGRPCNVKCSVCGKFGDHPSLLCPYFRYYPEGAHIEPDAPIKLIELHGHKEIGPEDGPRRAFLIDDRFSGEDW